MTFGYCHLKPWNALYDIGDKIYSKKVGHMRENYWKSMLPTKIKQLHNVSDNVLFAASASDWNDWIAGCLVSLYNEILNAVSSSNFDNIDKYDKPRTTTLTTLHENAGNLTARIKEFSPLFSFTTKRSPLLASRKEYKNNFVCRSKAFFV